MQQENFKEIIKQMRVEKEKSHINDNTKCFFSKNILFCDFVKQWNDITKCEKQISTFDGYIHMIDRYIYPYFLETQNTLIDLKVNDIHDYFFTLKKYFKLSPTTISRHYEIIKASLNYAVKNKIIKENPCDFIKKPKKDSKEIYPYNEQELKKLMSVAKHTVLESSIYLSIWYGLRRSEVLGLRWENVDFVNNRIYICEKVVRAKVNGKLQRVASSQMKNDTSKRVLPMSNEIRIYLLNLKAMQPYQNTSDYVCVYKNGKPIEPDYLSKNFSKLLKQNGLRHIRFHDLRHSCATYLINKNLNMKDVSEWLGHADISTTINMYTHIDLARKNIIANEISKIISF